MKQIKYNHSNGMVNVFEFDEKQVKSKLEPKIYSVVFSEFTGFYLKEVTDKFILPEKIYGNTHRRADRIIDTYNKRNSNTGVILVGDKGSGKSLLSQTIANRMIESGVPVILVQEGFIGDDFMSFINKLGDCVVIFDEFAKTYANQSDEPDYQDKLLTMFDGASSSASQNKILYIVLENDKYKLNDFLIDRPGRFYYRFEYDSLEKEAVLEYINDKNIEDEKFIDDLLDYSNRVQTFSFDILQAIVEEKLRYDEDLEEIVKVLNVERQDENDKEIILSIIHKESQKELTIVNNIKGRDVVIRNVVDKKEYEELENNYKINNSFIDDYYHLKYQEGNKLIYDNDDFILVTKIETNEKIDYKKYL